MKHQLIVAEDPGTLAKEAARFVTGRADAAMEGHGSFHFAVSGGRTPWEMFAELTQADLSWDRGRCTRWTSESPPTGTRSATSPTCVTLSDPTPAETAEVVAMPVTAGDLDAAASYAKQLPERFDLVHLMGSDHLVQQK